MIPIILCRLHYNELYKLGGNQIKNQMDMLDVIVSDRDVISHFNGDIGKLIVELHKYSCTCCWYNEKFGKDAIAILRGIRQ